MRVLSSFSKKILINLQIILFDKDLKKHKQKLYSGCNFVTVLHCKVYQYGRTVEMLAEDPGVFGQVCADRYSSERARGTHWAFPSLPSPPNPGTFHYGSKMYLRVSWTQSHLFPGQPLGCTGATAVAQGYPLAFTRVLTERRSLMLHWITCTFFLWHNGPNVL